MSKASGQRKRGQLVKVYGPKGSEPWIGRFERRRPRALEWDERDGQFINFRYSNKVYVTVEKADGTLRCVPEDSLVDVPEQSSSLASDPIPGRGIHIVYTNPNRKRFS